MKYAKKQLLFEKGGCFFYFISHDEEKGKEKKDNFFSLGFPKTEHWTLTKNSKREQGRFSIPCGKLCGKCEKLRFCGDARFFLGVEKPGADFDPFGHLRKRFF